MPPTMNNTTGEELMEGGQLIILWINVSFIKIYLLYVTYTLKMCFVLYIVLKIVLCDTVYGIKYHTKTQIKYSS